MGRMKNATKEILKELLAYPDVNKEILAHKFQVSSRTIDRWTTGETEPSFGEFKMLKQIYNGYKSQQKNE